VCGAGLRATIMISASLLLLLLLLLPGVVHAGGHCAEFNGGCNECYAANAVGSTDPMSTCTWCPGFQGTTNSPCISMSSSSACPGGARPKSQCSSQCTPATCPEDSACHDGPDEQPICTCRAGFTSVGGSMCRPLEPSGAQLGQSNCLGLCHAVMPPRSPALRSLHHEARRANNQ
jgi:hypothetical protein